MRRTLVWAKWSAWKTFTSGNRTYKTRNCKLKCGKLVIATLVESTHPRYGAGERCFMYSGNALVKGTTPFRTARKFVRSWL